VEKRGHGQVVKQNQAQVEKQDQAPGQPVDRDQNCTRVQSAPPYQIIIYKCRECDRGKIRARNGDRELSPAALQAAACDSSVLHRNEDGAATASQQNRASVPPGVRRQVLARDHHRCRMRGCGQTRFLEVHHLVPRKAGGKNNLDNLVTLCASCHRLVHELFLKGNLPQEGLLTTSREGA
jgi:hypothetical protein